MQSPADVKKIIAPYTAVIDAELRVVFERLPELDMYKHLAYFMGFRNESLEPEVVYGGKRFRSSLMAMLGAWYGVREAALPFAVALELYHNFTLVHDDVVDRDSHRRGRPTVWHLFGQDHAINDGDAQLLLTTELLVGAARDLENGAQVQQFLLSQFRTVVEGQYLDFELTKATLGDSSVTVELYTDMIRRKTAELIVAATEGAGMVAGVSAGEQELLATYGRSLGMAYQICDDVISIWETGETTGKRNYGDLKERKKTLPILYAYEHLDESDRSALLAFYTDNAELNDTDCGAIITLLDTCDTKGVMQAEIVRYAKEAKKAARTLSIPAEQQEALCALADSLLPCI